MFREEKKITTLKIFLENLNLSTRTKRIDFILCIFFMLQILAGHDFASYSILMENLIEAIKEKKISKELARIIVRKLIRKQIPFDLGLILLLNLLGTTVQVVFQKCIR